MKTSEFYKKIEELGFELGDNGSEDDAYVCTNKNDVVYFVELGLTDDYIRLINNLKHLDKELRDELVATCMDYAFTPIEERKEEKKYYWKIKNENFDSSFNYLNKNTIRNTWYIDSKGNFRNAFIAQFTEREYKKMVKDKFVPDMFEKEEIDG